MQRQTAKDLPEAILAPHIGLRARLKSDQLITVLPSELFGLETALLHMARLIITLKYTKKESTLPCHKLYQEALTKFRNSKALIEFQADKKVSGASSAEKSVRKPQKGETLETPTIEEELFYIFRVLWGVDEELPDDQSDNSETVSERESSQQFDSNEVTKVSHKR